MKPLIPNLPETCGVAFKEWAGVCQALSDGRQTVILRKGGTTEGPGGFTPDHGAFWLYPTTVHQNDQGLKPGFAIPATGPDDPVSLAAIAVVASIQFVDRIEALERISALHAWTDETVRARFHYKKPGLWAFGVRIFLRDPPWRIPVTPEQLGCKSWVPLKAPLSTATAKPVLEEADFLAQLDLLTCALDPSAELRRPPVPFSDPKSDRP